MIEWVSTRVPSAFKDGTYIYHGGRGYGNLVELVRMYADLQPSRNGDTYELLNLTTKAPSTWLPRRAKFNFKLLCVEALSIIAGTFDKAALEAVAPNAALHLFTEKGAYGPRLKDQMWRVCMRLRLYPDSRQVVAFVGNEADDMSANLPCTLALHWLLRGSKLHCFAHMRSWDLVKGLAYDVPCFGWLNQAVAKCIGAEAGDVVVTADSAHVYDADSFRELEGPEQTATLSFNGTSWEEWQAWALNNVFWLKNNGTLPMGVVVE